MNIYKYILLSTACLSVSYVVYLLIYRNEHNFRQLRFFLLFSMILSVLIPLSSFSVNLNISGIKKYDKTTSQLKATKPYKESTIYEPLENFINKEMSLSSDRVRVSWSEFLKGLYLVITILLLARILVQLILILYQYLQSERVEDDNNTIIYNNRFKNTFSFFNWIFIHKEFSSGDNLDQMISHEKVHAAQYHSFDLIIIELLSAVMWFNPLVWKIRNTIQLLHEYLADEGALSSGIDKLRYQVLLINQVTEERLICLSSSFNNSIIKKRMIMINKSKMYQKTGLRILAILPLAAVLILGVACVKGRNKTDMIAVVAPVKMNVLYVGVDNPMAIAASGYEPSELKVTVDNGTIEGSNGNYIIRPDKQGRALVSVSHKDHVIQTSEFRVKTVPDPVAAVKVMNGDIPDFKINGNITKQELLNAGGIFAMMRNFDFDLNFDIASFVMSATVPNSTVVREEISKSDKFSPSQVDLIHSLIKNQKLMIEEIKVTGPDGMKRKLNPMVFTIAGD